MATIQTITELIDVVEEQARKGYATHGPDFEHPPLLIVIFPDQPLTLIEITNYDQDTRAALRSTIEALVRLGPSMIAHVHETWMMATRDPARVAQARKIGVSNMPPDDRMEALMVEIATRDEVRIASWKLLRTKQGAATMQLISRGDDVQAFTSYFLSGLPWGARS